jgi:hypothetical protein
MDGNNTAFPRRSSMSLSVMGMMFKKELRMANEFDGNSERTSVKARSREATNASRTAEAEFGVGVG